MVIVLFFLVIGGIAWVVQFLPNYRTNKPRGDDREVLRFAEVKANDVQEIEQGPDGYAQGHYDYAFDNVWAGDAQMGLRYSSCDCSQVKFALLSTEQWQRWEKQDERRKQGDKEAFFSSSDLPWTPLTVNEFKGIDVPEQARGLVRVSWKTPKGAGQRLRLRVEIWAQPKQKVSERHIVSLETPTVVVLPLIFAASKISLNTLAGGGSVADDVVCWSTTRKQLDLQVVNDDPLCLWKLKPLNDSDCRRLEEKLSKEGGTRILSAYRLSLIVFEEKGGKQRDQGPFFLKPTLTLGGQALDNGLPLFIGKVQGEVDISGVDEHGKIQLGSFRIKEGAKQHLVIRTEPDVDLGLESHRPSFLTVKLRIDSKESTARQRKWVLEVAVPPDQDRTGPLGEESAIFLRLKGTSSRKIRIPIIGTAVPG